MRYILSSQNIDDLLAPLIAPSGIWADYNPVVKYHRKLLDLQKVGIINHDINIPTPDISDYTDLISHRSATWGDQYYAGW